MTLVDIEAPAEVQVPRDQWGRPLCHGKSAFGPDGTVLVSDKLPKRKGMQRVTTLSKGAEAQDSLMSWGCRVTLLGAAQRPDIIASVQATDPNDRKALDAIVERAKELGGANVRRELGIAVHKFFELKAANPTYQVPDLYRADVDAILAAIDRAGFDIVTEHSEQLVVIYSIGCAGTPDLILRRRSDGAYFIADLKTGASIQYGQVGWSTQLSCYSMADAFYVHGEAKDGSQDRLLPMPEVDRHRAFIVHCEPQSGRAELHELTIGAEFVELAVAVREIRKRRDLLTPFEGGGTDNPPEQGTAVRSGASAVVGSVDIPNDDAAAPVTDSGESAGREAAGGRHGPLSHSPESAIVHEARTAWLVNRAAHLADVLSKQHLAQVWPVDIARPAAIKDGSAVWTEVDIDTIVSALDGLEAKHDIPFGDEDPKVTAQRRADLAAKLVAEKARIVERQPDPEPTVEGGPFATADDVALLDKLTDELRASTDPVVRARAQMVQAWQREGDAAGVPWKVGDTPKDRIPVRLWTIVMAAIGCMDLLNLDAVHPDTRVRDALAVVLDDHDLAQKPTNAVGAMFGLLSVEQAERLAGIADQHTNNNKKADTP